MNQREISELKRRLKADKSNIRNVYGCYVNTNQKIISRIDAPLGLIPQEEAEIYLDRLKKSLSGVPGKNLIDILFSAQQVADSDEHRLLMALRDSQLNDAEILEEFFHKIVDSLDMPENNYLILLAYDSYDIPRRGKDGIGQEESEQVFRYILCAICPVKEGSMALRYCHDNGEFHVTGSGQTAEATTLGFLFPTFDDRMTNINNALYYARNPADLHNELIEALFHTETPMSAAEQQEAFHTALADALEQECSYEVIQAVHEQLREKIMEHDERKDPEPLELSVRELGEILTGSGVSEGAVAAFSSVVGEQFGEHAVLTPGNLIDSKRFEIRTPDIKISVNPEYSYLVESRVIDGRKYLLIPAENVEVNGLAVSVSDEHASIASAGITRA